MCPFATVSLRNAEKWRTLARRCAGRHQGGVRGRDTRADRRALSDAGALFLAFMAVAYAIEWFYFPQRWLPLSLCYLAFAAIVTGAIG